MMVTLQIDAEQVDNFANALSSSIHDIARDAQTGWMQKTVLSITQVMEHYPPETEANQPPPPYYIRGVGRVMRGGKIQYTSGNLGANWANSVTVSGNEVVGEIRNKTVNPVTGTVYSSLVHGVPERGQARIHTRRGWPSLLNVTLAAVGETTARVVYSGRINLEGNPEQIAEEIARQIEQLGG